MSLNDDGKQADGDPDDETAGNVEQDRAWEGRQPHQRIGPIDPPQPGDFPELFHERKQGTRTDGSEHADRKWRKQRSHEERDEER